MPLLPHIFLQSISCCDGYNETEFVEAHQQEAPTSIRLNPFKPIELIFPLNQPVLWNNKGFYLPERPNFTHDIAFQAGCYYVQEAGSMFVEEAIKQSINLNEMIYALDLCASPGGKSTLINSLLNNQSILVANEIAKQRADVLCQNLTKWGNHNVIVTNNDPSAFSEIENCFDLILVDAPCSGSGLFRKQHGAIDEWSLDNVNLCASRQKRILAEVMGSLKQGGTLVYSTCSYSEQENEEIVDWLLNEFDLESNQLTIDKSWGITETTSKQRKGFGYRFYPHKTKSEGFFCAVFKKKKRDTIPFLKKIKHEAFTAIKQKEQELFNNWIAIAENDVIIKFKDDYLFTNQLALDFLNRYQNLYYKKVGTNLGTIMKGDLAPHHDLALSNFLNPSIQSIECNEKEALLFLKKESQNINGIKGWNLMRHNNYGIGWIKHLGNRFNNYLPNEYRILK